MTNLVILNDYNGLGFMSDSNVGLMDASQISYQLTQTRNELNNIRKGLQNMKALHKGDVEKIENLLSSAKGLQGHNPSKIASNEDIVVFPEKITNQGQSSQENIFRMKPIGYIKSLHIKKNGTPRQGSLMNLSRGKLEIIKDVFNNPSHSLEGLEEFSHVWIIYFFHQNASESTHSKVSPPRLDGKKVGVFSTRSPHRPNSIGLTLAKLDKFEGNCIQLSGIDILDGTPILDIKPYIPQYDCPTLPLLQDILNATVDKKPHCEIKRVICDIDEGDLSAKSEELKCEDRLNSNGEIENISNYNHLSSKIDSINSDVLKCLSKDNDISATIDNDDFLVALDISNNEPYCCKLESDTHQESVTVASWLKSPPVSGLEVIFNPIAEDQIKLFGFEAEDQNYRLEYLKTHFELRTAISSVLSQDPRSTYRRQKCPDRLYFFMVDTAHITAWFFQGLAEVLRVQPPSEVTSCFNLV